MSRAISKKLRKSVQAEVDPLVKVFLITMYHDDLTEPIRVSSDDTERLGTDDYNIYYGTRSNGKEFLYAGFEASLANDEDGSAPTVQISIPNANRKIIEGIEAMGPGPMKIDLQLVFADTPDVIEIDIRGMEMSDIEYDEDAITGVISRDLLFNEPHPFRTFTPIEWPFLFINRVR